MEREHEEAMRADFTARTRLIASATDDGVTEAKIDQIFTDAAKIAERWTAGPHREQWQFLSDAEQDWRERPDTMRRFLDNVEHNRAQGWDGDLDEVQRRSLYQARELTQPTQRTQPTENRPRGSIRRER